MDFDSLFDQLDDEQLRVLMGDPRIQKIMKATECEESHDLEHHWPFNVDRQEGRKGCIYCGKTKREVTAGVVNSGRKRRGGPIPKPGSFPKPGD